MNTLNLDPFIVNIECVYCISITQILEIPNSKNSLNLFAVIEHIISDFVIAAVWISSCRIILCAF